MLNNLYKSGIHLYINVMVYSEILFVSCNTWDVPNVIQIILVKLRMTGMKLVIDAVSAYISQPISNYMG